MRRITILFTTLLVVGFATSYEVVKFDNNWAKHPLFNVIFQSSGGVEIVFSAHEIVIENTEIDGVPMKTFGVPSIFLPAEGAPNLTGASRFVAIPQDAHASVTILDARTEVYHDVAIAPAANYPFEHDNSPLRYEKNMDIYGRDAYWPESPIRLSRPKQIRGVDVVLVGVLPFQYNPVTKELLVYKDIRFRIDFCGGNGHFGEDRLRSRFWEPILQEHLLNYPSLPEIDFYAPERLQNRDNVEYIIIVPNDATFEAWGDTIARWRKLQGISSEVFTLAEVGGSTKEAIKNFLQNAYNTWSPAPVAFLLLSDYPSSGDAYGITSNVIPHPGGIYPDYAADNWYADYDNDTLPELHHARICAQTGSQLSTMINKFLSYERSPYNNAGYYDHPLIAGGWQSDRWFQMALEVCRGFLDYSLGRNPTTQYSIYSGSPAPGCPWSTRLGTTPTVIYWYNHGYIPMTNPYDNAYWSNGSATGINNAINTGTFIVQHRDHGSEVGWSEPSYDTLDLNGLSNTMLTFVNSTNCLTGRYHWTTAQCFTEKFHRMNHGALGLNAATSSSVSFFNDTYIWGMFDFYWPTFDNNYPTSDMTGYDDFRPCMAMTSGKYYLEVMWFPDSVDGAGNYRGLTYGLFHHHGDCFMTLYSQLPQNLTVSHAATLPEGQTYFTVTANDNSVIALTVNGEIIGVAEGTGSPVDISITPQSGGNTMIVTVTKANYRRYTASVLVVAQVLTQLYTHDYGASGDYTSISAYCDTMFCIADYLGGSGLWCRYLISYNGGTNWLWWFLDDTTVTQESPDVTCRRNGQIGVVYRFYTSTREMRYTWRRYDYVGGWSTPVSIADNEPYWNKPCIEYLDSDRFGVVYLSWNNPYRRAAYFDRSDWVIGVEETTETSAQHCVFLAPNPSKTGARLSYNVCIKGNVRISLYDIAGRLVRQLVDEIKEAGEYVVAIDNRNIAAGVYFVRIETPQQETTRSMTIIK